MKNQKSINYKYLLKKYIEHVGKCTHSNFHLSIYNKEFGGFSDCEWEKLEKLKNEIKERS
jgi:hypothetical protein